MRTCYTEYIRQGERDMTITSKFAGQCRRCGQRIQVGEKIEWERGQGATHTAGNCGDTTTPRAWLASQPKNVREAYRLTADERAELKAEDERLLDDIETSFVAEWTREVTIARRARWNAAKVMPYEIDRLTGYCERLDMNADDLKAAIARHGL